jgi:hypothetical protein
MGGIQLFYANSETLKLPTFGHAGGSSPILNDASDWLSVWEDLALYNKGDCTVIGQAGNILEVFWMEWYSLVCRVASLTNGAKLPATIRGLLVSWQLYPEREEDRHTSTRYSG